MIFKVTSQCIQIELEKQDFQEIADDFIQEHKEEYKNFCKGVAK